MNLARDYRAFTLVEVLVVIAIIGILISVLLPAVNAARETARRTSCANNLKQLAIAINLHEEAHHTFPTGGWGQNWTGDPDAGFGPQQPGGWVYNTLPYLEENSLREIGKGLAPSAKRVAMVQVLQTPIPVFNCPSRRPPLAYTYTGPAALQNAAPPSAVAKSDYAMNSLISYQKSQVIAGDIQRMHGFSKTILVGEKSLNQDHYIDGQGSGDTLTMYVGDSDDIRRSVSGIPVADAESGDGFGGPHSGCNIAMCDGAVRFVAPTENLQP
jgi:prepilin-type N-terminal cleavage/methylation domain-containing protein